MWLRKKKCVMWYRYMLFICGQLQHRFIQNGVSCLFKALLFDLSSPADEACQRCTTKRCVQVQAKCHLLRTDRLENDYQPSPVRIQHISFSLGNTGSFRLSACGWPFAANGQTRSQLWCKVVDRFPVMIDWQAAPSVHLPVLQRRRWTGRARCFHRCI